MTTHPESNASKQPQMPVARFSGWLKAGVIAGASALAGGLAAAWWYRKTLKTLRQTGETAQNPHFGIPPDHPPDEA